MISHLKSAVLLLAVSATVAACGGDDVIDRGELETQVQTKLTEEVGQKAPKAVCADELEAKVGADTRCHMDFPEGKRLGITVKVKSVDGEAAKFDILADKTLTETPS